MYLKGIEINGFKSFSNKVNLEFNKGITAIVGPNGSGKSNVLDAVLWVLGEQSYKSIRAKDGKDVIFSGGKNKKARSSATVSLYIDNSDKFIDIDSNDIVITRTINRNGENIYNLNGRKVRLKDINNLLMDTGIGKQAYSVIGQGKVDRIISSSSQELRNILDEAAGVKKAKTEKEIALKKLNHVENEVEKIEFVEKDLEKRVEELEKQSKIARQYRAYTKQIDILKYLVYSFYISKFKLEIENSNKKSIELEFSLKDLENSIFNFTEKISENNEKKKSLEENLQNLLNSNDENSIKLDKLNEMQVEYISKKANFDSLVKVKKEQHVEVEKEKNSLEFDLDLKNREIIELNKSITIDEKNRNDIESLIHEREEHKNKLENGIKSCEEKYKNYEVDKLKLEMTIQDIKKRMGASKNRIDQVEKEKKEASNNLNSITLDNFNEEDFLILSNKLQNLKNEYSEINKDKNRIQVKYEETKTKFEVLDNTLKNNKLMNNAIQFIQKKSENDKLVYGPLVNMIEVPQKYHLAITTIAGYSLNDIVVENSDVANKYVTLLKKEKVGSASFLPIQNLSKRTLNNGEFNYARNLVINKSKNSKIKDVINHVFGNSIVVDNLKEGIILSKKVKDRIVSLEGDVISQTGRITGGYITKKVDETLKMSSTLHDLKKIKDSLEEQLQEKNKILKNLQEEIETFNTEYENKKTKYETYMQRIKAIKREISTYEYELKDNNEFVIKCEKEIKVGLDNLKDIDKKIIENSDKKENLKKELLSLKTSDEEKNKLNDLNIKIAIQKEKKRNLNINLEELENSYRDITKKYNEICDFLNNKEENYKAIEDKIISIKESILEIQNSNVAYKEKINELTKENIAISEEYKKLIEDKSKSEIRKNNLDNEYTNVNNQLKRVNIEFNKYSSLLNEIEVYDSGEYTEKVDEMNVKILERKILLNEKSRNELGEVNLSAIKDYDEQNDRYQKLKNEKFDLLSAKDSVLKLIDDIDQDIITNFSEASKKIQENFSYMCRELLHGAKGTLKIQDENDLIETGLELNVKYKNKPEQSLSLLSGGEKSMLAVAFIISIFMYKPSPFTFFDEVEAALDEQNTIKLVSLLKKFTYSQFIMITHNKQTMKGADKLYGITMNKEVGESVVVSVDI